MTGPTGTATMAGVTAITAETGVTRTVTSETMTAGRAEGTRLIMTVETTIHGATDLVTPDGIATSAGAMATMATVEAVTGPGVQTSITDGTSPAIRAGIEITGRKTVSAMTGQNANGKPRNVPGKCCVADGPRRSRSIANNARNAMRSVAGFRP